MPTQGLSALPLRTDRGIPKWDDRDRESVEQYFDDLQRLFDRFTVTDEADKKSAALTYVPSDVSKRWKTLPEFTNKPTPKTYDEFKAKVLTFYVGADVDQQFTMNEYDSIVGERNRLGIASIFDYMSFFRKWYPVARYLIDKHDLAERQAVDTLISFVPADKKLAVELLLRQKDLTKAAGRTFKLDNVHDAVNYVFRETAQVHVASYAPNSYTLPSTVNPASTPSMSNAWSTSPAPPTSGEVSIKTEVLQNMIANAVREAVKNQRPSDGNQPRSDQNDRNRYSDNRNDQQYNRDDQNRQFNQPPYDRSSNRQPFRPQGCYYCGGPDCYTRNCPVAANDIAEGLCLRQPGTDRLVLPGGGEVPRGTAGRHLHDKFVEWHRLNPGQKARGQLSYTNVFTVGAQTVGTGVIRSDDEEIEVLQQQLKMLQDKRKQRQVFDGVFVPPRNRSIPHARSMSREQAVPTGPMSKKAPTTASRPNDEPSGSNDQPSVEKTVLRY